MRTVKEEMAFDLDDAVAEAAKLALQIGSVAADAVSFVAELGEELPLIQPVLKTLAAVRDKVETVKCNREGLEALSERCTYITACVILKCRRNPASGMDVAPLEACVEGVAKFVGRCSRRGRLSRVLKASGDKEEIAWLNAHVDQLTGDLGLAGIATLVSCFGRAACPFGPAYTKCRQSQLPTTPRPCAC